MKKIFLLTIFLLTLQVNAFSDEVISEFSDKTLPVLNEELRQTSETINSLETRVETLETTSTSEAGNVIAVSYHQRQDEVACNTAIPENNNTRVATEGTEVLSVTHTPKSNSNILKITVNAMYGSFSGQVTSCAILLKGTTVLATARQAYQGNGGSTTPLTIIYFLTSPGTSALTFTVRVGEAAGNGTLNAGTNEGHLDNGAIISTLVVEEIKG